MHKIKSLCAVVYEKGNWFADTLEAKFLQLGVAAT